MSAERLVVIGGDAAGMSAASEARRRRTTVDEIAHLDLGYAPPFSPVWDPVLIAARKAWARVEAQAPPPV